MGRTTAEYGDGVNPEPSILGWSPSQPVVGRPGEGGYEASADSDAELALALQLAEMQQVDAASSRAAARENAMGPAAPRQQSMEMLLSDPVWGDLHFLGKDPSAWDKLCFGCCPCFIVGCTQNCCILGQVTASLDPKRTWKRVLSSFALWISALQVLIFIFVVFMAGGFVPLDKNQMIGPHPHYLDKVGAKNTAKIIFKDEWWRLFSPLLLHGGVVHICMNMIVQLRFGMLLEVLWGHSIFLVVYWLSGLYSIIASCIFLPNNISVGSSGAICGLIGAELVFILATWRQTLPRDVPERNLQLVTVGLTIIITAGLSFLPLVDSAAHGGGFFAGAALGLVVFAERMQDYGRLARIAMKAVGVIIVVLLLGGSLAHVALYVKADQSLLELCMPPDC